MSQTANHRNSFYNNTLALSGSVMFFTLMLIVTAILTANGESTVACVTSAILTLASVGSAIHFVRKLS